MQLTPFVVNQLFEFVCGPTTYRYTTSVWPITANSNLYTPAMINVGAISASSEQAKNGVMISVDSLNPVAQLFLPTAPPHPVEVTILRHNEGGLGLTDLVWAGTVLGVSWNEEDIAELTCEPITVSIGRNALTRRFSRRCPYALYDSLCGVDKALYQHTTTVSVMYSAEAIAVASLLAMSYTGGMIEWHNGTYLERRYIMGHIFGAFGLMQPFTGLTVGASVTIYPGCDRTIATCHSSFDNRLRYGGFPYMRVVNVFKNGMGNYSASDVYTPTPVEYDDVFLNIPALP